jgi:hypothetical protein
MAQGQPPATERCPASTTALVLIERGEPFEQVARAERMTSSTSPPSRRRKDQREVELRGGVLGSGR